MTELISKSTDASARKGVGIRFLRAKSAYLGVLPFFTLALVFLLWPTYSVISGALINEKGQFSLTFLNNTLHDEAYSRQFLHSLQLSIGTSIVGAIFGALFAWVIATGNPNSFFRRISLSLGAVLAQFGGVMLVFAFLATFGFNGLITTFAMKHFSKSALASPSWLYGLLGLGVIYLFFQIPLMFIVFLPSVENLRVQWREASDSLGGSTREYWLRVGLPILFPSFIGSTLLLFVNAFSAYATAAALISQGSIITPLGIAGALSSEVGAASAPLAKTLSLFMVVVVVIAMSIYALIRRQVSKWEQ